MTDQKETPTEYVAKVAFKLQDFWTEDPDLWFLHAEAAFRNAQITQSKTKFDQILQKLPQKIMGLFMWPDHGFCCLLSYPLQGFKGQACLFIYSITLAKGF